MKVAYTNRLDMLRCLRRSPRQVCDKPVCVAQWNLVHYNARKSRRQSPQTLSRTLSRTQITEVGDVICVADFCDLCLRLCRKVVIMEFGFKLT